MRDLTGVSVFLFYFNNQETRKYSENKNLPVWKTKNFYDWYNQVTNKVELFWIIIYHYSILWWLEYWTVSFLCLHSKLSVEEGLLLKIITF